MLIAAPIMEVATTHDLRVVIAILDRLIKGIEPTRGRLCHAPAGSRFSDRHATRLEVRTSEQTNRISAVIADLESCSEQVQ